MDIEKAIAGRRAVREYTNQAVDEKTIRGLIAAAVLAPEVFKMNTIQKSAVNAAAVILLFGQAGCTVIGAGVGAVGGAVLTGGNPVGVVGGAVVGGVIGHGIGQ